MCPVGDDEGVPCHLKVKISKAFVEVDCSCGELSPELLVVFAVELAEEKVDILDMVESTDPLLPKNA